MHCQRNSHAKLISQQVHEKLIVPLFAGFTAVDFACSAKNAQLLRRLEAGSPYSGWLMLKVPRFGGLGSEWQPRWCVVMHRYPYPGSPPSRQVRMRLSVYL